MIPVQAQVMLVWLVVCPLLIVLGHVIPVIIQCRLFKDVTTWCCTHWVGICIVTGWIMNAITLCIVIIYL